MAALQTHCSTIWNGTDDVKVQKQIKLNMMGVCLLNLVSSAASQRLEADKDKWFFPARGGKDGLLIFKLLMQYSLQTTRYGAETTKVKLHNLNAKDFGNNVEMMLIQRKTLIDDLHAQGEIFSDDLYWAFKCLETVDNPAVFKRYIEDKKSEWEEGADITAPELCKAAQTKYKNLFEAGKWKLTAGPSLSNEVKEKDDAKFIALVAAVKELSKQIAKPPNKPDGQKNQWKYEAPAAGAPIEKQVEGKMFWWCTGRDGKHHKPMFCRHKPQECKEQEKNNKSSSSTDAGNNESKSKTSAPKLKLNNNLAAALAALDGVLKQSTDSDQEKDSETDFQHGV
jgi:hypothetical protein